MTSPTSVSSSSLPLSCIATATKTAFTREFNKTHCMENFVKSAIKHVETSHEDDMNDEAQGNQNDNNKKTKKNNHKGIESNDSSDSSDDEDDDENDQMNDEIDKRRAAAIAEMKRQSSIKSKVATSNNTKGKQKAQTSRSAKNGKVDNISGNSAKRATAGKRQTKTTTETKAKGKGNAKSSKTKNVGKNTRGKKRSRDESESDSIHDVDDTEESSCVSSDSDSEE